MHTLVYLFEFERSMQGTVFTSVTVQNTAKNAINA